VANQIADIPGGSAAAGVGLYHQWIIADGVEAGLGTAEGVPGENGQTSPDMPVVTDTYVVDHTGRDFEFATVYRGLDVPTVRKRLKVGRRVGKFVPLVNDCNDFVEDVVSAAAVPEESGRLPSRVFWVSLRDFAQPGKGADGIGVGRTYELHR
jgi:hypothetical protein